MSLPGESVGPPSGAHTHNIGNNTYSCRTAPSQAALIYAVPTLATPTPIHLPARPPTYRKLEEANAIRLAFDVVRKIPMFKNLGQQFSEEVASAMTTVHYEPNTYICQQGADGENLYVLTEGSVRITKNVKDENGNDYEKTMNKLYAENREDNVFGEIAMLDPSLVKRTANVISQDQVTVLALTKSKFRQISTKLKPLLMRDAALRAIKASAISVENNKDDDSNGVWLQDPLRDLTLSRFQKVARAVYWSLHYNLYMLLWKDVVRLITRGNLTEVRAMGPITTIIVGVNSTQTSVVAILACLSPSIVVERLRNVSGL